MVDVFSLLVDFGADPNDLHLLEADSPGLLPYATLVSARRKGDANLSAVQAVYEWQGAPLLFVVDAQELSDKDHLHRVRRLLAMRGDAPYLGVVDAGRLEVYRIELDRRSPAKALVLEADKNDECVGTISRLANLRPSATLSRGGWISNVVLKLLTGSIDNLIKIGGVSNADAISLVGRALFARFLADRSLLPESMSGRAANLFDDRLISKDTSRWLDSTFNGDLLPLSDGVYDNLPLEAYSALGDIMRKAPSGQLFLGWEEKWDSLDFSHIPVGVLSQAYELYLRNHAPEKQKREGGYYTPRAIADLMVRASFKALERDGSVEAAKVLDPAAGAGVFLLTAFRELAAARWRADCNRPDTKALRSILYGQITGFDINEAALRFAALGLYLLSIELDPNPTPVDKLRFENLRGRVLHLVPTDASVKGAALGSLGPLIGLEHNASYDLVVGNPPWSSATKLADWHLVREMVGRISQARRKVDAHPPLPNEGLDLPFLWRAMEWAKPGGQIAFALHARLLFQQGDGMACARRAIFEALELRSVINGVELRQTKVWPEISAPFCVLIASNSVPSPGSSFRLVSPRREQSLNDAGAMRIDALNSEVVSLHQLLDNPSLLKTLFRGTKVDLGLIERIKLRGYSTIEQYWRRSVGETARGRLKGSGNGYQRIRGSSRVRKAGDGLPGVDASYLHGLLEISMPAFSSTLLDARHLDRFLDPRIHDPRSVDLFRGPLLLVHKSPPAAEGRIGVAVSDNDAVFSETFYGYSARDHQYGALLVRFLALVIGSKFAIWFALMTSGEFGFEREVIEKAAIDRMPIPDFDKFSVSERHGIAERFDGLCRGDVSWSDIDEWVAGLYGLGARDLQVVSDTLDYNLPFAENKSKAQNIPSAALRREFCNVLAEELAPWCERFGSNIAVKQIESSSSSPWIGLDLLFQACEPQTSLDRSDWEGLLRAADRVSGSEVVVELGKRRLLVGRLAQQRYWSSTHARLLAQRVIWSHLSVLRGEA